MNARSLVRRLLEDEEMDWSAYDLEHDPSDPDATMQHIPDFRDVLAKLGYKKDGTNDYWWRMYDLDAPIPQSVGVASMPVQRPDGTPITRARAHVKRCERQNMQINPYYRGSDKYDHGGTGYSQYTGAATGPDDMYIWEVHFDLENQHFGATRHVSSRRGPLGYRLQTVIKDMERAMKHASSIPPRIRKSRETDDWDLAYDYVHKVEKAWGRQPLSSPRGRRKK